MCGIFMAQGDQAGQKVLNGLKRLEYRGYDSWGVCVLTEGQLTVEKHVGKIGEVNSLNLPNSTLAIGHTRWATHGGVTEANAHPHAASDGSFMLAQNGVVQNYHHLKTELQAKDYAFLSETDTEVIVRLIEEERKTAPDLLTAIRQAFKQLEGRNTIIVLTKEGEVIAARNGSPLVVGFNHTTGETFLSSDTLSFAQLVEKMVAIENGQLVHLHQGKLEVRTIEEGTLLPYTEEDLNLTDDRIDKEGYDHFMLKEINETPTVIRQVINQPAAEYHQLAEVLKQARQVYTIGSGTAGIAAAQLAFYLREYGQLNAISLVGADAVEYFELFGPGDVMIAPSQSGETADVLEVLDIAKAKGTTIVTYVNMQGATMTRMADYPFLAQAGPEICVMSTKIFSSQIAWGYLVAKTVQGQYEAARANLTATATALEDYLQSQSSLQAIKDLAQQLITKDDIFLLGKAQNFQIIREGMVKLIEGTYKHAHALPAGDLKHYAITLMETGVPVIVLVANDRVKSDVLTAAHEVKARGASVIGIAPENDDSFETYVPIPDVGETTGVFGVVPLQLLAYYSTVILGHDVDHPRNIAKSVTVK